MHIYYNNMFKDISFFNNFILKINSYKNKYTYLCRKGMFFILDQLRIMLKIYLCKLWPKSKEQ